MIKWIKYLTFLTIGIIQTTSYAQDTLLISKTELLAKIESENLQIKMADQNVQAARADYKQSNALFLPNISVSHTAMVTTNPLMAFGFKLNQELLTAADFNPALLNNPDQTQTYATLLEFAQPIINVDGLYERKAAKSTMEIYELQSARTKEYMQLEVSKAYMQLQLAYRAESVLATASETAKSSLVMVQNYYKQGMLQMADVLDVEIRVNEVINQWRNAQSSIKNASDYLSFLMNEEVGKTIYQPSTEMETAMLGDVITTDVPESRKDILAMSKSSEAHELMLKSRKMSLLPRLNAFGNYQLYDTHLFGTSASGYLLGVQLSWTVFDGYKTLGKLEKSRVEYERMENQTTQYKAQSDLELIKAKRQLTDALNKAENAKLGHQQAQEVYRIRKDRFTQGLVTTSELLQSEAQQFKKELEHLQALFEYHFTNEYINFLTK